MDLDKYLKERAIMVEAEIDRWFPREIEPEVLAKHLGIFYWLVASG